MGIHDIIAYVEAKNCKLYLILFLNQKSKSFLYFFREIHFIVNIFYIKPIAKKAIKKELKKEEKTKEKKKKEKEE